MHAHNLPIANEDGAATITVICARTVCELVIPNSECTACVELCELPYKYYHSFNYFQNNAYPVMEADRCEIIVEPEDLENSLPNAMQVEKTTTFTLTASTIIGSGIRKDWSASASRHLWKVETSKAG